MYPSVIHGMDRSVGCIPPMVCGWIVPWLHPPTVHGVAQSMAVCPLIHGMDRPVPPFPPQGPLCAHGVWHSCVCLPRK